VAGTASTPTVDTNVHCRPPSVDTLYPYLTGHWPDFLRRTEVNKHHGGKFSYPDWSEALAIDPQVTTLANVQEQILDRADYAILNSHWGVDSITHPDLAAELQRAVNMWVRDEWLERDERLFGSIVINPNYADTAVEEIERAAQDRRFVQVLLPVRAREEYGNPRFWPIWEAAAEHDLVVALIYGGAAGMPPTHVNWLGSFSEDYVVHTLTMGTQLMSVLVSGVLQKWPSLRLSLVESGLAWVPSMYWRMDAEWRAYLPEVPWVKDPPSTYARRFFRFTTAPADLPGNPEHVAEVLEQFGNDEHAADELLMYGSAWPQRYKHGVEPILEGMGSDQVDRIMGGNAHAWFGLGDRAVVPA
jgi:predicted TIM-barrel fold metal-dependent hydrolase